MENKKTNYFVRILIVLLCAGIAVLVGFKFFYTIPQGEISGGLITLIVFLIVLVLAESFDNFSVGKLLTIKREIEKKEEQNQKLEKRNQELLSQIFQISNNQQQSTTSVYGDYYSDQKMTPQNKEVDENVVQELLDAVGNSVVITDLENKIKTSLEERNLPYQTQTETILIRYLAGTQLALTFETIHNALFGSQIKLLKNLNSHAPDGLSQEAVDTHISNVYNEFQGSFTHWDNEKYLAYLYSSTLITKKTDGTIHLTNMGLEYLAWIVRNGKRENNPL